MFIRYNPKLKSFARDLRNDPTRSEAKLWFHLKKRKMLGLKFTRQKPIDRFIIDFFCNQLKLAIELDGLSHQFEEVRIKDRIKEEALNRLGISVLRFEDYEVLNDIDTVLDEIERNIQLILDKQQHPLNPPF